jgi:hypothetical protein
MDEINSQNSTYELQGKICGGWICLHQTKSNQMDECDFVKWNKINFTNVVEMDFNDMTKCHVNLQVGRQPSKVQRNLPHVNLANSKSK